MRVAIVDDEREDLAALQNNLARYSAEKGVKIDADGFFSGDALLKNYRPIYDIIILDINTSDSNGIDTACQIREQDEDVVILFVANSAQYAINAFEVGALNYMLKPISYHDFAMKFHRAVYWASCNFLVQG